MPWRTPSFAFALCSYGLYEEAFGSTASPRNYVHGIPPLTEVMRKRCPKLAATTMPRRNMKRPCNGAPASSPYRAFLLYRLASIKLKNVRSAEGERYLREAIQISPDTPKLSRRSGPGPAPAGTRSRGRPANAIGSQRSKKSRACTAHSLETSPHRIAEF